jgi:hypothetical protein
MPFQNYGLDWDWSKGFWGKIGRTKAVDFNDQIGIYLLQKGSKVVYVGKSGTGPQSGIGGRLVGHQYDDKKGLWNRVSWFGMRPVRSTGSLVATPTIRMDTGDAIRDIETVLIYVLGPKLNRASGHYKHMTEYTQCPPPV